MRPAGRAEGQNKVTHFHNQRESAPASWPHTAGVARFGCLCLLLLILASSSSTHVRVDRPARRTLVTGQFETAVMDRVPSGAPPAVAPDGPSAWLTGGAPLDTWCFILQPAGRR